MAQSHESATPGVTSAGDTIPRVASQPADASRAASAGTGGSPPSMMLAAVAVVFAGIILLLIFIINTGDGQSAYDATKAPGVGRTLDGLQLEPLVGGARPLTLSELRGKVVLVNFWGPWCKYCHMETPHLVKLSRELQDRSDFQFVSVSCSSGHEVFDPTELRTDTIDFLQRKNYDFAVHWDPAERTRLALIEVSQMQAVGLGYPTTFVLDRGGAIRGVWPGYVAGNAGEIARLLDDLLAADLVAADGR